MNPGSRVLLSVLTVASLALSQAQAQAQAQTAGRSSSDAPIVTTRLGKLQGARRDDVDAFLGVPFGQTTAGANRWRAPLPAKAWKGVRVATTFGASCYQQWPAEPFGPFTSEYVDTPEHSEDCLYLNVWAPATRNARIPVFVWIHGGGFGGGSGAVPIYDGIKLASQGIVVVTINYRVGPFGFLAHPELLREAKGGSVGNYGLQDMVLALRWVRANIAAFGGDPQRVTIGGQSAGAVAVNDLVVSPVAKGLFVRSIAQSGSGMGINALPLDEATTNGVDFVQRVGAKSIAELRTLPPEKIMAAMPSYFGPPPPGAPPRIPFRPVLDGAFLVVDAIRGDAPVASQVPHLTGFTYDDFMPFMPVSASDFVASVRRRFAAHADRILALYPHATDAEADASMNALSRDIFLASVTLWTNDRARTGGRVYAYLFDHPAPYFTGRNWGSFHTSEVPLLFGVMDRKLRPYTAADDKVSAQLQRYWLNFIRMGDPNGTDGDVANGPRWMPVAPGATQLMGIGDRVGPRDAVSTADRFEALKAFVEDGGILSVM